MTQKSARAQDVIAQRTIFKGNSLHRDESALAMRWIIAAVTITVISAVSLTLIEDPLLARTLIVAGVCLTLWLSEVIPPYVPTIMLWALVPLLLRPFGDAFRLSS